MFKKDDIPSPFKVFIATLVFQGPIYAFFADNKQSVAFYVWSMVFLLLNSLALSVIAILIKKPLSPFIGFLEEPEHVWDERFKSRRTEKRAKTIKIAIIAVIWLVLAFIVFREMSLAFQRI